MNDLNIRLIDGNLVIIVDDKPMIIVDTIYFIGKAGSNVTTYFKALEENMTDYGDRIQKINIGEIPEPSEKIMIIYVDTNFKLRFDRMIEHATPDEIDLIVDIEEKKFEDFEERLEKYNHLIIE